MSRRFKHFIERHGISVTEFIERFEELCVELKGRNMSNVESVAVALRLETDSPPSEPISLDNEIETDTRFSHIFDESKKNNIEYRFNCINQLLFGGIRDLDRFCKEQFWSDVRQLLRSEKAMNRLCRTLKTNRKTIHSFCEIGCKLAQDIEARRRSA